MRTAPAQCIALVKEFEGLHEVIKSGPDAGKIKAYRCPAGVLTIGYGSTRFDFPELNDQTVWTVEQAEAALLTVLNKHAALVAPVVSVKLNDDQFSALVSFCYNCGLNNLRRSTLLKKLNSGDYKGAAAEFKKWNLAVGRVLPGLTRRRLAEQALFERGPA